MKLVASSALLAAVAQADVISLVNTLKSQGAARTTSTGFSQIQSLTGFTDYGCWCYFATNNGYVGNGFGAPVDSYDRACKTLHDNYACMTLEDSTCDPFTVSYTVPNNFLNTIITSDDLRTPCETANPDDTCAQNACTSESAFIQAWLTETNAQNTDYLHSNVNYDPTIECALSNGFTQWSADRGEKQCCGNYPNKQVYFNGNKDCCGGIAVYNTATKVCCSMDSSIRNIGDTCPQPPQICVTVEIHPTNNMGAAISSSWDIVINDGAVNNIQFPSIYYSQGTTHTQCTDMVGSKTVADVTSVTIQHPGTNSDGGLFSQFDISYDGGAARSFGVAGGSINPYDGFWIDGDSCPGSGHPCCDNGQLCPLVEQTGWTRMMTSRFATIDISEDS